MSNYNFTFSDINEGLPKLLKGLDFADEVGSRNGRTKEHTHVGITYTDPRSREIILDHRKPNLAAQIAETMWILAGRNDIEFLSHYLPRAKDFSDDGKVWRGGYGPRIRSWTRRETNAFDDLPVDQLKHVIDLLKRDPLTRQAVIGIYDADIDAAPGKDIPCNDFLIFTNRLGKLDLNVTIRSNDVIWGHSGINYFEWSVLLEIVAGMVGVEVGQLHFNIASLHMYDTHWAKAKKIYDTKPLLGHLDDLVLRSPSFEAGTVNKSLKILDERIDSWFRIESMIRGGEDVGHLVDLFPEPMMQSWLRVIRWWWTGDHKHLKPLAGTQLELAAHYSMQPPSRTTEAQRLWEEGVVDIKRCLRCEGPIHRGSDGTWIRFDTYSADCFRNPARDGHEPVPEPPITPFMAWAIDIHNEKHEAYGDSWKKRGEMMSILANIARKIDRLDSGKDTTDESQVDTATDLMVYLAKYQSWLDNPSLSDTPDNANFLLVSTENAVGDDEGMSDADRVAYLSSAFEDVAFLAENQRDNEREAEKRELVDKMLWHAYRLASLRWSAAEVADEDEYKGADVD